MAYKAKDQFFPPLVEGNVRTTGSSLTLGVGELAFVDISKTTKANGVKVLNDFTPLAPTAKLAIRMGEPKDNVSRSEDNKAISTIPFKLKDVVNIYVDAPQKKGVNVDDFVIGYNGQDGSELDLDTAENEVLEVCLKGDLMGMIGLPDRKHTARINLTAPIEGTKGVDWTMHEIVEKAFLELKNYKLPGNIPITDFVDVMLVNSENPATLPGTATTFYNLVVSDEGTESALGAVQAQYPALDVKRTLWEESGKSTYTVMGSSLPAAYQPKADFVLKGCEDCPAGYTALDQGFVYQVTFENDGADELATVQALPGATALTAVLIDTDGDINTYSVVTDDALTQGEIDTFVTANPTAVITLAATDVVALCESATPSSIAWVAGESCNYSTEDYAIVLKDDCDGSRLAELQAAYPDLTITEIDNGSEQHAVTVTGTSGTANITIDGTDYLATFDTDLATTAANFVTAHGADIETNEGYKVTSDGAVITLVGDTSIADPTIANVSGDLAGSVATSIASSLCQRKYSTTVTTSLVCEECSEEFRDIFESEAPEDFDSIGWQKVAKTYSATAKMGIRVRGIRASLSANEFLRDDMFFFDDSVEISLVGGYPTYTNESYLAGTNERFTVKYFGRKSGAHNLGGNLRKFEEEAQMHFRGRGRYTKNNYGKIVNGQETRLEGLKNYVVYSVTIAPHNYVSNFQQPQNGAFTYHFPVDLGKHEALEAILNKLAAATGITQVQAVSK